MIKTAKNGGLEKVVLNEPLDFICRDLPGIKNTPIKFDGSAFGDPKGNELEPNMARFEEMAGNTRVRST